MFEIGNIEFRSKTNVVTGSIGIDNTPYVFAVSCDDHLPPITYLERIFIGLREYVKKQEHDLLKADLEKRLSKI